MAQLQDVEADIAVGEVNEGVVDVDVVVRRTRTAVDWLGNNPVTRVRRDVRIWH